MRDRFMDSVKGREDQVTDEGRPVRSFARNFFSALFSIDEEEEVNRNEEITSEDKSMEIVVPSPSKTTAVEDDQMLKEVKELPRESKISVLLSIMYGLTGRDEPPASERLPKMPEETEACRGGMPIGVDNRGLDCDEEELRSSQPDPIADTQTHHEIFPNNASPDSRKTNCSSLSLDVVKMNSKPSVVSGDPESGLSDQSGPTTVRVWLKDPHLYKVSSFCLWRIAKRILNVGGKTVLFQAEIVIVVSLRRWPRSSHVQRLFKTFHSHICRYFLFTRFSLRRYLNRLLKKLLTSLITRAFI